MRRIEGANAVEIATGKLGFRGRNSAAGLPGTAVTETWLNDVQEELLGAIEGAGLAPAADRSQLLKAIRSLGEPYAVDTGAENALVVDLATPGWTLAAGKSIRVRVAASVTYAATIQVSNNGTLVGTWPLIRPDGTALHPYDLWAGQVARLTFDGASWQIPRVDGRTGDETTRHATGALAGYVRKNGRTIGPPGSGATERAATDCRRLYELYWSDTGLAVAGGRGANAAADWAAGKTLALPDARGRVQAGLDDMGAPAAGRLTATYFGQNGTVLGAAGGLQSAALATANLPPISYTPAGSVSVSLAQTPHAHGITDPGHNHSVNDPGHAHTGSAPFDSPLAGGPSGAGTRSSPANPTPITINPATTGIWLSPAGTGIGVQGANANISVSSATFAGQTVQLGGSSQASSTVQPTITVGIYIRL